MSKCLKCNREVRTISCGGNTGKKETMDSGKYRLNGKIKKKKV